MFSSCLVFFWFFLHWIFLLIGKFTKNLWCLCWIHRMLQGPLWCEIPHGFSDIFMWVVLVKCSSYEILVFYTEKIVLPNSSSQLYLKQVFQGFAEQNFTITILISVVYQLFVLRNWSIHSKTFVSVFALESIFPFFLHKLFSFLRNQKCSDR